MPNTIDVSMTRKDFPALHHGVNGRRLAYLDNAATTQKPQVVLDSVSRYYAEDNANVHRAVHTRSRRATEAFDAARARVARFVGASKHEEIVFTKGCTEAINLVAGSWGRANLREGDVLLVGEGEHHANIVPWQLIAAEKGAVVTPIPLRESGELDVDALHGLLGPHVKLVAVKHVCNALGTVNPIADVIALAHKQGAVVLVDGAQALAHEHVDVSALDVDCYAMSSHKVYGPMGVGALYAREDLLAAMPPYQGGGDMIRTVSFDGTTFANPPNRFEAGTPNVGGVVGFARALDYVDSIGLDAVQAHERDVVGYLLERLATVPGLRVMGEPEERAGIVSFVLDGVHPHDIGTIVDAHGVAIRTGHHCCMPLMARLGVPATARASLAVYNGRDDVDQLVEALMLVRGVFA